MAKKITKIKPVIVLKAGKTAAGEAAARSHTAALAGSYEAHEALFRQYGFTIAEDLSDLLHYAKILSSEPKPKGGRVAIITNGGGTGVLVTDAIGMSGYLKLADFSDKSKAELKKVMPPLVNIRNPLDLAGDAGEKRYGDAMSILSIDENVDMFLVIVLFQTPGADSRVAASLIGYKEKLDKPMIVISIGTDYTKMHKIMMESAGLPVYDSPAAATRSLVELLKYSLYLNRK